jgi:YfiH family protein
MMNLETVKPVLTDPFVLYQSALLSAYAERLNHGFTGKGAGEHPFTLGGPGFDTDFIQENRRTLCRVAGLNEVRLSLPRQTHTDRYKINDLPCEDETDAVIVTEPGVAAMVQVADCVPVILYAPDCHVGAVVHAGWRGTAQGITQKVATVLIEEHHAAPEHMIAAIGPSIGGCCYEVSAEVADAVGQTVPEQSASLYRKIQPNGKPRVDLKSVNALQLRALGLKNIEILNACTRCLPESLWSFRRNESGRQVGFLQLK